MKTNRTSANSEALRKKAEEILKKKFPKKTSLLSEADMLNLIHELEVHQIELELQEEELIWSEEQAAKVAAEKYAELLIFAPIGYFALSNEGKINELNLSGASMLGKERSHLKNTRFVYFVSDDTKPIFNLFLEKVFNGMAKETCEVTLPTNGKSPVYVRLIGNVSENGEQCIVNAIDITDQKQAEEALKEKNLSLQTLLNAIPAPVFYKDCDGRYISVNKSFETFFGQTSDEIAGKTVFDVASGDLAKTYHAQDMEIIQNPDLKVQVYDSQVKDYNGVVHDVVFHKAPFKDLEGKVQGLIGVILDFTERKRMEKSLLASEEKFKSIYEGSNDAIMLFNRNGFLDCNTKALELFGLKSKEELIDLHPSELSPPVQPDGRNSFESANEKIDITYQQGISRFEWIHRRSNGDNFPADVILSDFKFGGEHIIQSTIRDITERKQTEASLRESERRFRETLENVSLVAVDLDAQGNIIFCNDFLLALTGWQRGEIVGKNWFDTFTSSESKIRQVFFEGIHLDSLPRHYESQLITRTGEKRLINWSNTLLRDPQGNVAGIASIGEDITDRKKAEDEVNLIRTKLELALQSSKMGVWQYNIAEDKRVFDSQVCLLLGIDPANFNGSADDFYGVIHPDDREKVKETLIRTIEQNVDYETEFRAYWPDGSVHYITVRGKLLRNDEGNPQSISGVAWDITERKREENEITMLAHSLKSINECVSITDLDNKIMFVNESFLKTYGYELNELIGKDIRILRSQNNVKELVNEILPATIQGEWQGEIMNRRKDGSEFPIYLSTTIIKDKDNNTLGLIGVASDISGRKQSELALRNSQKQLHTLVQTIPDLIWLKDTEGVYLLCNSMFDRFFGANEADIIGKTDFDFVDRELADSFRKNDRKAMAEGKPSSNEEWVTFAVGGNRVFLDTIKTPMYDSDGKLIGVLGIGRDITERKQAELALQASEELYRNLVLRIPDGVYRSTPEGKFTEVNPALVEMLGYDSKEELLDIDIKTQLYFEVKDRESLLQQEKLQKMGIYQLKKKDGSGIWVEDHGWYNTDENGNILSHEGILRDISDRKRAEELLQISEERYRTIVDNTGEGIGFVNAKEQFEYANIAAEKIFGVEPGGLVGKKLDEFISPKQFNQIQKENLIRVMDEKSVYELDISRPDGEKRFIRITAVAQIDKVKGFMGTYGVFSDITERKQIEDELVRQQYLMNTLMDNLPDHIYFKDLEGKFFKINKAHARLNGFDNPDEAIGKSDFDFFSEEHAQQAYNDEQNIIKTGEPLIIEEKETYHDRPDTWVSTVKMPLYDGENKIIGTFGISRDITRQRLEQEEIKLKNEELQKANAEKDKFFSIIAHDLRSPFNSFLGYTELMVEELDNMSLKEIQFMAVELKKSANNLYNLLENLLEWSRIQRGIAGFEPKLFLLMPKISESIQSVFETANKKEVEIRLNIPEDVEIFADENMLKSTVRNFTTNAVKFTPKGGKVTISAKPLATGFVEISVSDTGIGMKKTLLDKLFELTEHTSRPGTEGEPSSGLGLILCKDFVEKHGGKIRVESEEGKGSIFIFTMPMKRI